ncbi:MAG: CDP-diacylglycerol diphosphatase, partial [Acetobacteraceae bacterium]|nr:CDP-diacylglycerol diphosphatase [Acetobacteraceae bacterium]
GQAHGDPSPCALVEPGYAVLKDLKGVAEFLLIPTTRITGIDDPAVTQPQGGKWFEAAWRARRFLEARLGRAVPRGEVSLAVNSVDARTQEQLHIHINCVRPDVRDALQDHADEIGPDWAPLRFPLAGQLYSGIRIEGEGLAGTNPFVLLKRRLGSIDAMKKHALVVVGSERGGRPGFVMLERGGQAVHGTELQDLSCSGPLGAGAPPR